MRQRFANTKATAYLLGAMTILPCILTGLLASAAIAGEQLSDVPANPDIGQKYIIYLHGRIVENEGITAVSPQFGAYEYADIIQSLAAGDADVIGQVRSADTDAVVYADKLAGQIATLISQGVAPHDITVAGFSKGGYMTLLVANKLQNPDVRYVVMAGCVAGIVDGTDLAADGLRGTILSMVDAADDLAYPCASLFADNPQLRKTKDVVFKAGTGHGLFYRADPAWIDQVIAWSDMAPA